MVKHTKKKRYTITNKSNKKGYARTNKSNKKSYTRNYKVKKNLRKTRKIMKGGVVSVDFAKLLTTSTSYQAHFETTPHSTGKGKGPGKYYTHIKGTKAHSRPHIHWKAGAFMGYPNGDQDKIKEQDSIETVRCKIGKWLSNALCVGVWEELFREMLRNLDENLDDFTNMSRADSAAAAEAAAHENRTELRARQANVLSQLQTLIDDGLNQNSVSDIFEWKQICNSTLDNVVQKSNDILGSIEEQITIIQKEFVSIDADAETDKNIKYVKKYNFLKAWCQNRLKFSVRLVDNEVKMNKFMNSVRTDAKRLTEPDDVISYYVDMERERRIQAEARDERAAEDTSAQDNNRRAAQDTSAESEGTFNLLSDAKRRKTDATMKSN